MTATALFGLEKILLDTDALTVPWTDVAGLLEALNTTLIRANPPFELSALYTFSSGSRLVTAEAISSISKSLGFLAAADPSGVSENYTVIAENPRIACEVGPTFEEARVAVQELRRTLNPSTVIVTEEVARNDLMSWLEWVREACNKAHFVLLWD